MQRYKVIITKIDPEAEELKALNRKIQENRDNRAAKKLEENHRKLLVVVAHHLQEDAAAVLAEEQQRKERKRKNRSQLRKLANRVLLCLSIGFGVYLSWCANLVSLEFLLGACFIGSCAVAFACGIGLEKKRLIGGDN